MGNSMGSVYGFKVNKDNFDGTYDFFYYFDDDKPTDHSVTSLDVNSQGLIAVAGLNQKALVLSVPDIAPGNFNLLHNLS